MSIGDSEVHESTNPTDQIDSSVEAGHLKPPRPPVDTHTFKCEKCGVTFTDEGSAAAHTQTCKVMESLSSEPKKETKDKSTATIA